MRRWQASGCALILGIVTGCGLEPAHDKHALSSTLQASDAESPTVHQRIVVSRVFHIDRKYRSMMGPTAMGPFQIDPSTSELLWITGFRSGVVGPDGSSPADQELLCHTNLMYTPDERAESLGLKQLARHRRLFTTSQGQLAVNLPPGFGIPVISDATLGVNTQALNHNIENPDIEVRHEMVVDFVRDAELSGSMEPLFLGFGMSMALVDGDSGVYGVSDPTPEQVAASCELGEHAPGATTLSMNADPFGRTFTQHWVVPPGREVRRTLITQTLALPFDTTVHFIGVHLHPFAESLEMRDLTTGETIYRSTARQPEDGIGLASVDYFSSIEGIPLYKDHEYEMVSVYNNTSSEDQDAMGTFFLYLRDRQTEARLDTLRADLEAEARQRPGSRAG